MALCVRTIWRVFSDMVFVFLVIVVSFWLSVVIGLTGPSVGLLVGHARVNFRALGIWGVGDLGRWGFGALGIWGVGDLGRWGFEMGSIFEVSA